MAEVGKKNDTGKPRFDLIPPDFMWLMADLLAMGAKKYADRNWEKGMSFGRVFAAMQRHAWKFWSGEDFDQEDGQRHLISVAWCAMVLLHYTLNGLKYSEFDDRVKGDHAPWLEPLKPVEIKQPTAAKSFWFCCDFPGCHNDVGRHGIGEKRYCILHIGGNPNSLLDTNAP